MTKYRIKYYRHEHSFACFIKRAKYVFSVPTTFVLEFCIVSKICRSLMDSYDNVSGRSLRYSLNVLVTGTIIFRNV